MTPVLDMKMEHVPFSVSVLVNFHYNLIQEILRNRFLA